MLTTIAVAALLWAAWLVAWACERRLPERPLRAWRALSPSGKAVASVALVCVVAYAGAKPGAGGASRLSASFAPAASRIHDGSYRAGFVLQAAGTNETFDFSAPEGAVVATNWMLHGAAEAYGRVSPVDWSFPFGGSYVTNLVVSAGGVAWPDVSDPDVLVAPLAASIGVVPAANWSRLDATNLPCVFWRTMSDDGALVLTWQNVLLNRRPESPVSLQAELRPDGGIVYRYDFARLVSDDLLTNAAAVVSTGAGDAFRLVRPASATNDVPGQPPCPSLSRSLTSLRFQRVTEADRTNPDRDGDGLGTAAEVFDYGTNPNLADSDFDGLSDGEEVALGTDPLARDSDGDGLVDGSDPDPLAPTSLDDLDGDGLPDAYEIHWFGGTNAVDAAWSLDETGFAPVDRMLAGLNPTNGVHAAEAVAPGSLVSWRLFDAFSLVRPANAVTNLVWERTFAVGRTSAWQQYFVSADPASAAPWALAGLRLEWETDTGACGSAASSPPGDSLRIPLAADDRPATLTLRLRATGGPLARSAASLHLLAYAPEVRAASCGVTVTGESGATFSVFTNGAESALGLAIDGGRRPHRAAAGDDEHDLALLGTFAAQEGWEYSGDETGGEIRAPRPGIYRIPDFSIAFAPGVSRRSRETGVHWVVVLSPSVWWRCAGHGGGCDGLGYDWSSGRYLVEGDYPLDTECLRRKWYRDWTGGWYTADCEMEVSSGLESGVGYVSASIDGGVGFVCVDGVRVWSGTAEHVVEYRLGHAGSLLDDGCGGCDEDCADGSCDSLEGPSLGSLKFRIPLGSPVKGQVAGFVWFAAEGPVAVSRDTFRLLAHPAAHVTDETSSGTRRIVCADSRGRDLRIANVAGGVRIAIYDTAAQTLEHTWEIVNVNGSTSQIRLRKISRQNNVMSDETYTCSDGDWTRFDNVAGVGTRLATYDEFADYGDGVKSETRTTTDAAGNVLSSVTTERRRIGECDNAVLRETYRNEWTGINDRRSSAEYWNDPAHTGRHGMPRLVWGSDRAWIYTDYDGLGHETFRAEQRNGSPVPYDFTVSSGLAALPDAFVTVRGYAPPAGDSCHADDAAKPRSETRYVVESGSATVIGRTWRRYTRFELDGYDAIMCETWRASSQDAAFGDADNAYSYEITYADTGDGTPLLMRNAVAESLDENGVLTQNSYALANGVLSQTSRRFFASHEFPTCETVETDAAHGTVLRRTKRLTDGGAVVADEQSVYDSQNRLRSTTYLDGTSLTNAYSCCRLLWRRDREGRKVLRSAQTGTDHLYHATEDVWLADVSTNGRYRVTQRLYDALGRETNTVVYAGATPGEATATAASDGKALYAKTTAYPYGGNDYRVETDARGKVTVFAEEAYEDRTVQSETISTNGLAVMTIRTTAVRNGPVITRREWDAAPNASGELPATAAWTEEHRFDDYLADGRRVAYVVTASSDCGVVTNSVTTYDFLGRVAMTAVPGANGSTILTVNTYDGASSRILASTYTVGDVVRTTALLYDDCGEQVGAVLDGITNRTETSYETDASNIVWRVETSTVVGPSTNSLIITRTQLTGLSGSCRRHTVTLVGIPQAAGESRRDALITPPGGSPSSATATITETIASFDPATGIETETVTSSIAPTVIRRSLHGILLSEETGDTTNFSAYDALGRVIVTSRQIGRDALVAPVQSFDYSLVGDVLAKHTYTNGTDIITETYAYDMLGNRIATTDALGNTTYRTYDPLGRVLAEYGATYPVRYTYDTAGRRTSLSTTRDGVTWDTTTWTYDHATGNCLSKTYADGSTVLYTYTPDNLLLRTTYASGRWKEYVYDSRRLIVGVIYSDDEVVSLAYDEFGNETATSNEVSSVVSLRSEQGDCTNETIVVSGGRSSSTAADETLTISRTFDAHRRLTGIDGTTYAYDADGLLASVSNDSAVADYAYTPDRLDSGYSLTLSNGMVFTRSILRDGYRRPLVTGISSIVNGVGVGSLAYTYDAFNRPTSRNNDMFGYNERGEVVFSRRGAENAEEDAYAYDDIGNLLFSACNTTTNTYTANNLNQYTSILLASASPREIIHDADGNMIADGSLSFTYDAANRLKTVSSNGVLLVANFYDAKSRRVKKVTPEATTTFFYDNWNLIEERIVYTNGTTSTVHYFWGKDISGTLYGVGGVGGLLYLTVDGTPYVPCYDNNGNITRYLDANGSTVAQYTYDAFGSTLSQYGAMCDVFRHRFSTKYYDTETCLFYYGYRFYSPVLMRWLNRDPIGEDGGLNQYAFCENAGLSRFDQLGLAFFAIRGLGGLKNPVRFDGSFTFLDEWLNRKNLQIVHEQLFFQDGLTPHSVGYGKDPLDGELPDGYVITSGGYDDCIMRLAVAEVDRVKPSYSMLGIFALKYNCQDYASALRAKYTELAKSQEIRCKCKTKGK